MNVNSVFKFLVLSASITCAGVCAYGAAPARVYDVEFIECAKCPYRMRVSDDGKKAYINLSRIDAARKDAMKKRAERFLDLAGSVKSANPMTPLMGWSSWNTFGAEISEGVIVETARAMATNGLKEAGYVYVNLDDGFFDGRYPDGRLRIHARRFPEGLKGTVDTIHALGMKAGIYSDAGTNTCASFGGEKGGKGAGLWGHDAEDCKLFFNELEFDFFKVDYCGGYQQKLVERDRFTEISKAIKATGRDVHYNICRWAFPGAWAADVSHSWRTSGDIRADWEVVKFIVTNSLYLASYAKPGRFNDLDMLEAGMLKGKVKSAFGKTDPGLTREEELSHFGMWCIMTSPLVLGCDVRNMDAESLKLVTNPYLLKMNQDPLALQAYVAAREGETYLLVKDAFERYGKSRWVALYNADDIEKEFTIKARDLDLGGRIAAFDLVERADIGEFEGEVTVRVRPHSSKFYLFDASSRLERTRYEAEGSFLAEYDNLGGRCQVGRIVPKWYDVEGASGGIVVANLGGNDKNHLTWKDVHVSRPGRYVLTLRVRSDKESVFNIHVDKSKAETVVVPASAKPEFKDVAVAFDLTKGSHEISIYNFKAILPEIDCLTVTPCR